MLVDLKLEADSSDDDEVVRPGYALNSLSAIERGAFRPSFPTAQHTRPSPASSPSNGDHDVNGQQAFSPVPHHTPSVCQPGTRAPDLAKARKVPIPRGSPSASSMTVMASGPMSGSVTVPPRAKPGRKPLKEGQSVDRRREQNRTAQRKFRDGRQQRLEDTKQQLDETVEELRRRDAELLAAKEAGRRQVADLQAQLEHANARIRELENAATSATSAPQNTDAMADCGSTKSAVLDNAQSSQSFPPPVDFTTYSNTVGLEMRDDSFSCGFCTDASNCQCRLDDTSTPNTIQPGTCSACQANPARAAACRRLASTETPPSVSGAPASTTNAARDSLTTTSNARTLSCVDFMDRATRAAPLESVQQLFGTQLHPLRSAGGGYELDEHEAAQGIALLAASRSR